ncbi:MAG: hypothetical protein JXA96_07995 [Sedimentisphaerales bacterium]|nr:hypothetical protein [Sedimentisphaerales bacterium]
MQKLTNDILKLVIERYLLPLFPGSKIAKANGVGYRKLVAIDSGGYKLFIKSSIDSTERMELHRVYPFQQYERELVENFIRYIITIFAAKLPTRILNNTLAKSFSLVIAQSISNEHAKIIYKIVSDFESIAEKTYEGKNISICCLLDLGNVSEGIAYHDILNEKHGCVLSNGFDTIIKVSSIGNVIGYEKLLKENVNHFAPYRYLKAAFVTSKHIVSFVLNRNKEILIFKNNELFFSKRRGNWQYYPNNSLYKQISLGSRNPHSSIRTATYLSSLDVSFSHGGGCIAIIADKDIEYVKKNIIKKGDCFENVKNTKAKHLSGLFTQNFKDLDRLIRMEMISIDGATIIAANGQILATGAIINLEEPSDDGARTAAAKTLAKYGISIKISMDGEIKVFKKQGDGGLGLLLQFA